MKIILPHKLNNLGSEIELDFEQIVVIGANGSGKTRFGSDIEKRYNQITHRVSAQKSLSMPSFVNTKSKEQARGDFLYGAWSEDNSRWYENEGKIQMRWKSNPNTSLLDDYEKLMALLQTEEFEESLNYKDNGGNRPNTKLDRIQIIWESVLPHRRLRKKAGVIEAYLTSDETKTYNGSGMSDGERVIFYLIAQVICAPDNSIVVIDEPELHIHKSIFKILFDKIENERPDCSLVYLTHDIDFAVSRQNAKKIWIKSYESELWDYEVIEDNTPIPEQLYLEVLGSRKPILFIEGDITSIDYRLYQQVFLDKTLKPLGGCEKVIQTVKSLNDQYDFHHITSNGLVDRDRRTDEDITKLNSKDIWVLDVAEAENFLLIEPVVRAVAKHMGKNADDVFINVKNNLTNFFREQLEDQVFIYFQESLTRKMVIASNFKKKNILDVI